MLEPGEVIGGKYRVGKTLGKGGMGIVVEAMHVDLGTLVAVKVLREDLASQPHLVERFLREARSAAQLRGEHICRVHDFGTLPSGAPFMVMEMLEGNDLAQVKKQGGPIPIETVSLYMMQACAAIAEPHARGMVHRDLKPGNVFLTHRPDGTPCIKILDFGIAKSATTVDFSMTDTTNVMGSPAYMSPEQLKSSKKVDPRSDIWSLGVVIYELVSGKQPFSGESLTALALCISTDPAEPMPSMIPPAFSDVVMKCLEKDPARRYQDVGSLASALAPFAKVDGRALTGSIEAVLAAPSKRDDVETAPSMPFQETTLRGATGTIEQPSGPAPRRRRVLGLAVAAIGLVAIALVYTLRPTAEPIEDGAATEPYPVQPVNAPPPDAPIDVPMLDAAVALPSDAVVAPVVAPVDAPVRAVPPRRKPATKPRPKPRPPSDLGTSRF